MQAKKMASAREMFIWSKLGQNLSEVEVRTFARIKKVIWDQLLATKVEIIQSKLYFHFACEKLIQPLLLFAFFVVVCSPPRSFICLNHLRIVQKRCSHSIFSSQADVW